MIKLFNHTFSPKVKHEYSISDELKYLFDLADLIEERYETEDKETQEWVKKQIKILMTRMIHVYHL
jgi:hypothetical protein